MSGTEPLIEEKPDEKAGTICVNVKTTKGKKSSVNVSPTASVTALKEAIAQTFEDCPVDHQRLIFMGRVMKDDQTLDSYKLKDGQMVIVIAKAPSNKPKPKPPAEKAPESSNNFISFFREQMSSKFQIRNLNLNLMQIRILTRRQICFK